MARAASESDLRPLARSTGSPAAVGSPDTAARTAFVNPPLPAILHLDLHTDTRVQASQISDGAAELELLRAREADVRRRFLDCRRQRNKCIKYRASPSWLLDSFSMTDSPQSPAL
jgi:hypothetical protein